MDLIPYTLTLLVGLFYKVEAGMILGTLAHLAILVFRASKPAVEAEEGPEGAYLLLRPDRALYFPAVEDIR